MLIDRRLLEQLKLYGIVGLLSNFLGYLVYLLLTFQGLGPKLAMSLLYAVGAGIGFFGNRNWTFRDTGPVMKSGFQYLLAHLAGYLLNLSLLTVFVDRLGYPHQLVQAIAIFVVAGFLFLIFKFLVFTNHRGGT